MSEFWPCIKGCKGSSILPMTVGVEHVLMLLLLLLLLLLRPSESSERPMDMFRCVFNAW